VKKDRRKSDTARAQLGRRFSLANLMRRFRHIALALPLLMAAAAPGVALAADPGPMATRSVVALPNPAAAQPGPLPDTLAPPGLLGPEAPDGKIHGMVSASVGTHGYREGAIALSQQLPNGTTLAIAVDAAQIGGGRARHVHGPAQPAEN
jgi:hypothetical protein